MEKIHPYNIRVRVKTIARGMGMTNIKYTSSGDMDFVSPKVVRYIHKFT